MAEIAGLGIGSVPARVILSMEHSARQRRPFAPLSEAAKENRWTKPLDGGR